MRIIDAAGVTILTPREATRSHPAGIISRTSFGLWNRV
jgi:hypothetical protein